MYCNCEGLIVVLQNPNATQMLRMISWDTLVISYCKRNTHKSNVIFERSLRERYL